MNKGAGEEAFECEVSEVQSKGLCELDDIASALAAKRQCCGPQ